MADGRKVIDLRTGQVSRPVTFYAEEKDAGGRIVRKVRRERPRPPAPSIGQRAETAATGAVAILSTMGMAIVSLILTFFL